MPAFQFPLNKRLRNTGLEGKFARAMLHEGALQLQDDTNHIVRIPLADISRVRIGYVEGKWRTYHTRIWRDALDKPLEIVPINSTFTGYRETITELTRQLAERDCLDRIETGSSKFDALLGPVLMAFPVIGAFAVALFVLTNAPWWGRTIVPLVPTILLAIVVWLGMRRNWPKPLSELKNLKVQLPPG